LINSINQKANQSLYGLNSIKLLEIKKKETVFIRAKF